MAFAHIPHDLTRVPNTGPDFVREVFVAIHVVYLDSIVGKLDLSVGQAAAFGNAISLQGGQIAGARRAAEAYATVYADSSGVGVGTILIAVNLDGNSFHFNFEHWLENLKNDIETAVAQL